MMTTDEASQSNPDAFQQASYFALGVLHGLPLGERMSIYDAIGRRSPSSLFAAYYVDACNTNISTEEPPVARCFDTWIASLQLAIF